MLYGCSSVFSEVVPTDKALFFLTAALCCVWLVIDTAVGNDYLGRALSSVFPFMGGTTNTTPPAQENVTSTEEYKMPGSKFVAVSPTTAIGWSRNNAGTGEIYRSTSGSSNAADKEDAKFVTPSTAVGWNRHSTS